MDRDRAGFSETYPAAPASVPRARTAVTRYALSFGLLPDVIERIRLSASEATTNAVRHAYPDGAAEFELSAGLASDAFWMIVSDTGCGYQTPSHNPGLGYGLAVIAEACDDFVITERPTGGTDVQMQFRVLPAG